MKVTMQQQQAGGYHARHCHRVGVMTTTGRVKIFLLAVALSVLVNQADAQDDVAVCVADHRLVQTARGSGHYLEGRDAAARCAQASCPQLIRQDCAAWYGDLADSTPSIVLELRDASGHDVPDAKVTLAERPLAVDGRAIALDPGTHELRVEAAGYAPHVERIMLRQGEHNRRVAITLRSLQPTAPVQVPRAFSPAVVALGSIGVAGLGTFAALAITGKLQQRDDDKCKPTCERGDVDKVNHLYLAADVAAAIGGSAAIAATVLYALDRKRERRVNVALQPLGVSMRGAF
jgi:hypothetical protein